LTPEIDGNRYLIAMADAGALIIHSSPITVTWVPRDIVNELYNLGGSVTVGTFETLDEAKRAAEERYSVSPEAWRAEDQLPFDRSETETHTPDIDGHDILRHGIRWK
jgi:hypothetical protein